MYIYLLLFLLHLFVCILLALLVRLRILKCGYIAAFMSLFLPVFGPVMALIQSYYYAQEERVQKEVDVSPLKADAASKTAKVEEDDSQQIVPLTEALFVNDPKTRRDLMLDVLHDINVRVDDDSDVDSVVPLEEALTMNDSRTKRALIMDVLYTNPKDYVTQLNDARTNDDSEVVHYAVTALVELQKEYDIQLQKLVRLREQDPDNRQVLLDYQKLMEQYLASGLLSGSNLSLMLENYQQVLDIRLKQEPDNFSLYYKNAENCLRRRDGDDLMVLAHEMKCRWPAKEMGYLYMIHAYAILGQRENVEREIGEIQRKKVYLSPEGKSVIEFWKE